MKVGNGSEMSYINEFLYSTTFMRYFNTLYYSYIEVLLYYDFITEERAF